MEKQEDYLFISDHCPYCCEIDNIFSFIKLPLVITTADNILSLKKAPKLIVICSSVLAELPLLKNNYSQFPYLILGESSLPPCGRGGYLTFPLTATQLNHVLEKYDFCTEKMNVAITRYFTSMQQWEGKHPILIQLKNIMMDVAKGNSPILLAGESGADQELIAQTIHNLSDRYAAPFVPVNCRSIPVELIEDELFGYERNQSAKFLFQAPHKGRLGLVNDGTLFLNELDAMPARILKQLSHILQQRTFKQLHGHKKNYFHARLIAATNTLNSSNQLAKLEAAFSMQIINVPPLRSYISDLPLLLKNFQSILEKKFQCTVHFTDRAIEQLMRYSWPQNRLECRLFIEYMLTCFPNKTIDIMDLPAKYTNSEMVLTNSETTDQDSIKNILSTESIMGLKHRLAEIEIFLIQEAIEKFNGNISHAAQFLKIGRTTLIEKMKKYQLFKMALLD